MSNWEKYLDGRLILRKEKYCLVKPDEEDNKLISFFCPVCNFAITSKDDVNFMELKNCCHFCYLNFCIPSREAWEKGWRPSADEIKEKRKNLK